MDQPFNHDTLEAVSKEDLLHIGEEQVAYIRELSSSDFEALYPGVIDGPVPAILYALTGADGEPLLISDDKDSALANASEQELEMVSLH